MDPVVGQIVTVFRNRLNPGAVDAYSADLAVVAELARSMPGFVETKTFTADDGERATIVTFADAGVARRLKRPSAPRGATAGHQRLLHAVLDRRRRHLVREQLPASHRPGANPIGRRVHAGTCGMEPSGAVRRGLRMDLRAGTDRTGEIPVTAGPLIDPVEPAAHDPAHAPSLERPATSVERGAPRARRRTAATAEHRRPGPDPVEVATRLGFEDTLPLRPATSAGRWRRTFGDYELAAEAVDEAMTRALRPVVEGVAARQPRRLGVPGRLQLGHLGASSPEAGGAGAPSRTPRCRRWSSRRSPPRSPRCPPRIGPVVVCRLMLGWSEQRDKRTPCGSVPARSRAGSTRPTPACKPNCTTSSRRHPHERLLDDVLQRYFDDIGRDDRLGDTPVRVVMRRGQRRRARRRTGAMAGTLVIGALGSVVAVRTLGAGGDPRQVSVGNESSRRTVERRARSRSPRTLASQSPFVWNEVSVDSAEAVITSRALSAIRAGRSPVSTDAEAQRHVERRPLRIHRRVAVARDRFAAGAHQPIRELVAGAGGLCAVGTEASRAGGGWQAVLTTSVDGGNSWKPQRVRSMSARSDVAVRERRQPPLERRGIGRHGRGLRRAPGIGRGGQGGCRRRGAERPEHRRRFAGLVEYEVERMPCDKSALYPPETTARAVDRAEDCIVSQSPVRAYSWAELGVPDEAARAASGSVHVLVSTAGGGVDQVTSPTLPDGWTIESAQVQTVGDEFLLAVTVGRATDPLAADQQGYDTRGARVQVPTRVTWSPVAGRPVQWLERRAARQRRPCHRRVVCRRPGRRGPHERRGMAHQRVDTLIPADAGTGTVGMATQSPAISGGHRRGRAVGRGTSSPDDPAATIAPGVDGTTATTTVATDIEAGAEVRAGVQPRRHQLVDRTPRRLHPWRLRLRRCDRDRRPGGHRGCRPDACRPRRRASGSTRCGRHARRLTTGTAPRSQTREVFG